MRLLLSLTRLFLGAVLLWSGMAKIRQPYEFLATVYSYELVGPSLGLLIAAVLPWLEIVVGCCLVGGVLTEGSFAAAVLLAVAFTYAVSYAWHRGLAISCGCFGEASGAINSLTIIRSVGVLMLSLLGLAASRVCRGDIAKVANRHGIRAEP